MTYEEYARYFNLSFDAASIDYVSRNSEYCLYAHSDPVLTPGGKPVSDPSEDLIRLVATDVQLPFDKGRAEFSSLLLLCFVKDELGDGQDPFFRLWEGLAEKDQFVRMKMSGMPSSSSLDPDNPMFSFAIITLSSLTRAVNRLVERVIREYPLGEEEPNPFSLIIRHIYEGMDVYQRAAVQAVSALHNSGIVLPLMAVSGVISSETYAKGVISLGLQPVEVYDTILARTDAALSFVRIREPWTSEDMQIPELIRVGEGDQTEFKSTLRWDIRAGKTNPAIERACLKTIAAFLNTSGGTLLIGVRDDGSIEGIETDKFVNEDKFLLHLWTLIRNCLGKDFSPFIRTRIEKMDEKSICAVTCSPSVRPAYLRQPGFDEELYIRVGPSSNALDISEAVRYVGDRFVSGM
jgi:hypothetical protein